MHSITLRDDNQPIEGRGIDPLVDIRNENWTAELMSYVNNQRLVNIIANLLK
ncbi:MAG: hypothetical protein NUV82_04195 [Candidatus Komeilibacteria bacterium]|nr:hypothetical protein [Candidatus Komeilibacteria bacterium]